MFGQTQDNMVEWEGYAHPTLKIPVYSLYGKNRKPAPSMIESLDALVIDLQDVGARRYTYMWTVKLCMEACMEKGLPLWIFDRPNPIGPVGLTVPALAGILFICGRRSDSALSSADHRRNGNLLRNPFFPSLDLNVVWMAGWKRNSLFQ